MTDSREESSWSFDRVAVSVSGWRANLAELGPDLASVEPYCEAFHFDVMDGHYVRNMLFGPEQLRAIRSYVEKPLEVHLMIANPDDMLEAFLPVGDVFLLHRETCRAWDRILAMLRSEGKRVGLVVRLDEDWRGYEEDLPDLDLITVMGSELGVVGLAGERTFNAIADLAEHPTVTEHGVLVQADGGIRRENVPSLLAAGADSITAGSVFFDMGAREFRKWIDALPRRRRK